MTTETLLPVDPIAQAVAIADEWTEPQPAPGPSKRQSGESEKGRQSPGRSS